MEVVLYALFVIAAVALFVSIPLRPGAKADTERIEDPERAELEARKESKYREIRDAELDREQGKLSRRTGREPTPSYGARRSRSCGRSTNTRRARPSRSAEGPGN